jgi:membrane-bound lytic murein transglycosylase D
MKMKENNRFNNFTSFINYIIFGFISLCIFSCTNNTNKEVDIIKNKNQTPALFTLPPLPSKINFCNENIVLTDEDIREKLDRELLVNTYFQSSTVLSLKRANRYFPQIEKILKEENIPEDFKYLAVIESGLAQAVSPVGAQGFWQFMPFTAKEFNLEISNEVDERLNIEKSTRAACRYLRVANDTLKDWLLTAASYNRGIGGVRSDMNWQGTNHYFDTDMNSETGRYAYRLLAVKLIFENPELYGFDLKKMELYKPFKIKSIVIKKTINNIADWSLQKGVNYKIITKLNPWLKGNQLTIKNKFYKILVPSHQENLKPYHKYS